MDLAELQQRVEKINWHHAIDLGNGIVTPGRSGQGAAPDEHIPDVAGRSVLDIGAWDGYYSFLAEQRGAGRVVALDHYAWGVDLDARDEYWHTCRHHGVLPDHARDETDFWRGDDLPGRAGFDLAKEVLASKVEPWVGDFMKVDLDELGTFDVVLYLGVLYHIKEPLTALERLRKVTGGVAAIETEGVWVPGLDDDSLLAFYAGDELSGDFGNWYAPTEAGLHALCRAAGFSRVETKAGPPHFGIRARALGALRLRRLPPTVNYRLVVHAYA